MPFTKSNMAIVLDIKEEQNNNILPVVVVVVVVFFVFFFFNRDVQLNEIQLRIAAADRK